MQVEIHKPMAISSIHTHTRVSIRSRCFGLGVSGCVRSGCVCVVGVWSVCELAVGKRVLYRCDCTFNSEE